MQLSREAHRWTPCPALGRPHLLHPYRYWPPSVCSQQTPSHSEGSTLMFHAGRYHPAGQQALRILVGKELQEHWRWRREGKRPRGPPAAPRSPERSWMLMPGPGAGWGTLSRAGRSGGLLSLTHWAGSPRAPAAPPLHPRQGRGITGGQQWEQGLLTPHPPPSS